MANERAARDGLTAAKAVEELLRLGVFINDTKGAKDWTAFLNSTDYQAIQASVLQIATTLDKSAIDTTISAISEKQQALLAASGGTITSLPTDKLLQYVTLGNLKLKVQATQGYRGDIGAFGKWLVDDALPVLLQAAPVVIPLLL